MKSSVGSSESFAANKYNASLSRQNPLRILLRIVVTMTLSLAISSNSFGQGNIEDLPGLLAIINEKPAFFDNSKVFITTIQKLSEYPYNDAETALLELIDRELHDWQFNIAHLKAAVMSLRKIGTSASVHQLESLLKEANARVNRNIRSGNYSRALEAEWLRESQETLAAMKERTGANPVETVIPKAAEPKDSASNKGTKPQASATSSTAANTASSTVARPKNLSEYLSTFEKTLNELILGQPEAATALTEIEEQNALRNGMRKVPEVAMLMGLPGAGKDTSVEAYIKTRFTLKHQQPNVDINKHLFRYPVVKKNADVWALTGSGTGYIGSGKISSLNRFLVLHSGGRYKIMPEPEKGKKSDSNNKSDNTTEYVIENPNWKPGQVLPGYFAPEDGALYINEFHDWTKTLKNELLKEALEYGFFTIGNPAEGINRIQVPINILLASNDGIDLIASRDKDGRRVGAPLTEEQLMERWEPASQNKALLKERIASPTPGNPEGGTSEELLSRIPSSRTILLRPPTRKNSVKIVQFKLQNTKNVFLLDKGPDLPHFELKFSPKLMEFLASYDQNAEEGARTFDDKIKNLVEKTLFKALLSGKVQIENGATVNLSVRQNKDGTSSLMVGKKAFLMTYTEKDREAQPLSETQIDHLFSLESELNKRVKGVQWIVSRLAKDISLSANAEKSSNPDLATKSADLYMFLGSSSTGKTELGVAVHQLLYSTHSKPLVIDFSQIQSMEDLKDKILGRRDGQNKSIPSDFMQEYDRNNGKLVILFDEITNANREVLTALYDIFRVPVVRTFSDKKDRKMEGVKIIMTGNAGEEWYRGIPRELPEIEQYAAARSIYEQALANEGYRRKFLMTKFTEAFLNRVGDDRIFFFGPHVSQTVRQLIQLKLIKSFQEFSKPKPGKITWDVKFQTPQEYKKTIEAIEDYGFKLWEQGASITHFIDKVLLSDIHYQLLMNKIPNRAEVTIVKTEDKVTPSETKVGFRLVISGRAEPLNFEIKGKAVVRKLKQSPSDILLTAFHEAGHELVNHVLLGDKVISGGVSILPGVTEINGQWISYAGVASHATVESFHITKEIVIAQIAVLAAGEAGEQLSTKNSRHTAGKVNDLQRATSLATTAILKWGLSEKWGRSSVGDGQNIDQYLSSLSAAKKKLFEKEVQAFIEAGRSLAKQVIIANYATLFNPIASHLAANGKITGPTLQRFYQQRQHLVIHPEETEKVAQAQKAFAAKMQQEGASKNSRDYEFYSFIQRPKTIVNIDEFRAQSRAKELANVDLSPGLAMVKKVSLVKLAPAAAEKSQQKNTTRPLKTAAKMRCEGLFQ